MQRPQTPMNGRGGTLWNSAVTVIALLLLLALLLYAVWYIAKQKGFVG